MELFYRTIGEGKPFIILHGLYGSSDNWIGFARRSSGEYRFFIPDMRNHGQSGHNGLFSYNAMLYDTYQWISKLGLQNAVIMGHSMGGKLAMELAGKYPNLFKALIVIDISPLSYIKYQREGLLNHEEIINQLLSIDLTKYSVREQVKKQLYTKVQNKELSGFLLKNLARAKNGNLYWRLNLNALLKNAHQLLEGIGNNYYCKIPALFIKAANSNYIIEQDKQAIRRYFEHPKILEIEKTNHWLHVERPECLMAEISNFLKD